MKSSRRKKERKKGGGGGGERERGIILKRVRDREREKIDI